MNDNDFRFYVEADLYKSEGADAPWIIGGLASTDSKDSQQETLDYNGFELKDLKWINWNHGKESKDLIGHITSKEIKKGEGLFIKGELHKSKQQAQEAYKSMQDLSKSNSGTKLSWSVEGKVLERDPKNPKKVTKARLFQVALCPTPVNGDTWADLVSKGFTNNEEMSKAMDLEATRPTHKESVEHAPKDLEQASESSEKEKNKRALKKSEIYKKIFNNFTKSSAKADEIYELLKSIDMEINDETIEKAKKLLNLASSDENVEKGYKKSMKKMEEEEEEDMKKAKMKKADDEEGEEEEEEMDKTKHGKKDMKKSESNVEDLMKSLEDNLSGKIESFSDLVKSQDAKFKALGELVVSQDNENAELRKSITELNERLGKVEEEPVKKSVSARGFIDRFEKSEDNLGSQENVYSISKAESKNDLMDYMMEQCGANSGSITDQVLYKGVMQLESTGQMSNEVIRNLNAKGIKVTG